MKAGRPLQLHRSRGLAGAGRAWPIAAMLGAATLSWTPSADAGDVRLDGSWSGGGAVTFSSGATERARCRAQYRQTSRSGYSLSAVCATSSGRASQTAHLRQVGANRYSGSFFNNEYGVSGTIHVIVRGSSQSVTLTSSSGSARLKLHR